MPQSLYALAFLACPIGMGLMMWMMMRGGGHQQDADKQAELARLQAQIDELHAGRERAPSAAAPPVSR